MAPLRAVLIDRDALARSGLRALLDGDRRFQVLGEAGGDPVRMAERLQPDLILLEPSNRGRIDRAALRDLRRVAPRARLVVLSAAFEPSSFLTAMLMRVHAWLAKGPETSGELITEALALVGQHGAVVVDASIAERFWSYPGTPIALNLPHTPAIETSPRER